jgi:hypothetical protein
LRLLVIALICTGVVTVVPAARAQTAAAGSRVQVYGPAFFAAFAPRSALDMVRQLPGFSLDGGNSDVRGLSGSAGNLVINGSRPSTKSDSVYALLERIPVSSVVRIEVSPGDQFGADYSGKAQVANLILTAKSGVDGSVTAKVLREGSGRTVPDLSATVQAKRGHNSLNLSAGSGRFIGYESGYDRITGEPGGLLREYRRKVNRYADSNPFVSVALASEPSDDRAVRLNARYAFDRFSLHQDNRVNPIDDAVRDDIYDSGNVGRDFELGGDASRPLAHGTIKLVGLATRKNRDGTDTYGLRSLGGSTLLGGFRQRSLSSQHERIVRIGWSRKKLLGFTAEVGGELAFNRLISNVDLFSVAPGGAETRIALPINKVTVSERRAEAFVTLGRPVTKRLRLDLALKNEWSQLKVRGDARADRTLRFLKPSATLDWQPRGGWHAQLSVQRTVAQLDFFDFISSAELNTDRVFGGNADLQPQSAWELRGLVEHQLLGDGKVKVEFGYNRINRLQDRILTPLGFDAPGNLGTGRQRFIAANIDAPLGKVWKGPRVKADVRFQETRVVDPLTGQSRDFSGFFPPWAWNLEVRRDHKAFAYGLTLSDRATFRFFRFNDIDRLGNQRPFALGFVEYRPDGRTTATLDVQNLLFTPSVSERLLFGSSRGSSDVTMREYLERNDRLRMTLTLKRTFGRIGKVKPNGQ